MPGKLVIFDWGWTLWHPKSEALMPGALGALREARNKGYLLAIAALASDGDIDRRLDAMRATGIMEYFDTIKISADMDKPRLYREILEECGTEAEHTIIVDDRAIRGIAWGRENGTTTVWFKSEKHKDERPLPGEEPDYTIEKLEELTDIL